MWLGVRLGLCLLIAATGAAHASQSERLPLAEAVQANSPLGLLRRLYSLPNPDFDAFHDPERRGGFYTPRIDDLATRAEECYRARWGMTDIDFDFIVPGQDYDIQGLDITVTEQQHNFATASVTFGNMGEAIELYYKLHRLDKKWLIDEVVYQGRPLSKALELACQP